MLSKINNFALKLLHPQSEKELYQLIVDEVLVMVGGKEGRILLQSNGILRTVYATPNYSKPFQVEKDGHTYTVFKEKKIAVFDSKDIDTFFPEVKDTKIEAMLMIPLVYKEISIGVIVLRSYKGVEEFNQHSEEGLKLLASMISLALKKVEFYEEFIRAVELRDFFIALAAQELRTPLTTITGYIDLLHKKLLDTKSPEAKWSQKLAQENERLKKIVDELLAVNRIKAGQLTYFFEECDINSIISQSIENFNKVHSSINLTNKSILSEKIHIIGDCEKLIQVITHLLENADKFSPNNTPVELATQVEENDVYIHIKDHGKGIEEKDIPEVFQGFYKPNYQQEHGFGIGLYLAQSIIAHHNGSITISSKKGEGTTVTIMLPRAD